MGFVLFQFRGEVMLLRRARATASFRFLLATNFSVPSPEGIVLVMARVILLREKIFAAVACALLVVSSRTHKRKKRQGLNSSQNI